MKSVKILELKLSSKHLKEKQTQITPRFIISKSEKEKERSTKLQALTIPIVEDSLIKQGKWCLTTKYTQRYISFLRARTFDCCEKSWALANVIDNLRISDGSRVLDNGSSDGVDPLLLLFLGVSDEVHRVLIRRQLERTGLVEDILGSLHGQARAHWDHATWTRWPCHVRVLEPEELTLLQHEPATPPSLDVLALLG